MRSKDQHDKKGISRRQFLKYSGVAVGSSLVLPNIVFGASNWPDRPITVVIGFSAGGGTDTVTRATAAAMEKVSKGTINCTNMPGSVGSKAAQFVWQKPSDGYWWFGTGGYNRALRTMGYSKRLAYKDWQFYASAASIQGWAVRPDSPYKDFGDFLDDSKKKPGKITVSMSNVGGVWHTGNLLIKKETGVEWNEIPYKGGAPATLALLQKESDVVASGVHEQVEFYKAGKLRNLAVFTDSPLEVEGVGTLQPVTKFVPGVKSFAPWGSFYNIALKRDTPVEVLKKVAEIYRKAADDPDFKKVLAQRVLFKNLALGEAADKMAAKLESIASHILWDIKLPSAKVNPKDLGIPRSEEFENWWPPKDYKPRI